MLDCDVLIKIATTEDFDKDLPLPEYETIGSAGADLRASLPNKEPMVIKPGKRALVPTGLKFEIPVGFEVQIRPRSGISLKTNLLVVNSPGTIDSDYRGEVKIIIGNFGDTDEVIEHGTRIAQMVVAKVTQSSFTVVHELSETQRGAGGFGSTGTK